jgi:hypothetical protein
MGVKTDAEAAVEAILARAKFAAVRNDPEIRTLLIRAETIKQCVEQRAKQRGPTSLWDLNEAEINELHEMLDTAEAISAKMEKYQLH